MAASPRLLLLSRYRDLSLTPSPPPPFRRLPLLLRRRSLSSSTLSCCLISGGVDGGGGVADDFVSTRRSSGGEFSALAAVLRRIEPLDTSVIGDGVSTPAKDSMKRTISTMLGLLPSDQFRIDVTLSTRPLRHLLLSSILTGYTLWNAEYRVSLMRNFESSPRTAEAAVVPALGEIEVVEEEENEDIDVLRGIGFGAEMIERESLVDLSTAASSYIRELELNLATAEKELHDQKHEYIRLERNKEDDNDLLKYLRSLEPDMVAELSQPSSSDVEEIIQQLVQNIHMRHFNDECDSFLQDLDNGKSCDREKNVDHDDAIVTTRDYLAKLLFWCMLLGHHLRGLEYRWHLSCFVGLS